MNNSEIGLKIEWLGKELQRADSNADDTRRANIVRELNELIVQL